MQGFFYFRRMWIKNTKIAIAYWIGWLVCMCFIFYYDTIGEYRKSEKVKAVVIEMLVGSSRRGGWYYYPQLQFEYKDSTYLFGKRKGFSFGIWDTGDKATAIFPAGEPDKAEVYSFLPYWVSLTKLFFGFIISLFLFVTPIFFRWFSEFKAIQKRV
jgi:hypothetical protein